jgi:hypothetical protein
MQFHIWAPENDKKEEVTAYDHIIYQRSDIISIQIYHMYTVNICMINKYKLYSPSYYDQYYVSLNI